MITVGVLENRPYKITAYLDKVVKKNNIENIIIIPSGDNADIVVVREYDKIKPDNVAPVIIINSDFKLIHKKQIEMKFPSVIIDCGISLKSSITASSITDEQLNYCVQRSFEALNGDEIQLQEFRILSITNNEKDIFNLLACITILLLSGISVDEIKGYKF